MRSAVPAAVFLALVGFSRGVSAQTTDLLLVLAADVSRSIDESEFALQRKGYSAAVTDPRGRRRAWETSILIPAVRGCLARWSNSCARLSAAMSGLPTTHGAMSRSTPRRE